MNDLRIATMTPKWAKELLSGNNNNRPLRKHRVATYADQMAKGLWKLTGDPIVVAADGRLLQGQHRLTACVQAEASFVTAFMENADPGIMTVLDSGLTRRESDVLRWQGIGRPTHLAGIARTVIAWRRDVLHDTHAIQRVVTRDVLVEFAEKNEEALLEALRQGEHVYRAVGGNRTAWGALAFELMLIDNDFALEFLGGIASGVGLEAGDARLAIRNWVTNRTIQSKRVDPLVHLCTYTRAWNNWVQGLRVDHTKAWRRGTPVLRPGTN